MTFQLDTSSQIDWLGIRSLAHHVGDAAQDIGREAHAGFWRSSDDASEAALTQRENIRRHIADIEWRVSELRRLLDGKPVSAAPSLSDDGLVYLTEGVG